MTRIDALLIAIQVMEQYANGEEVNAAIEILLKMKRQIESANKLIKPN